MYVPIVGLCVGVALVAAFPNRSLLGYAGTLLFAGSALALLVLFVISIVRSIRSRTLHGGQLLAGGILLVLALFIIQRLDGPSPETKIERTIGVVATSTDPAYCDQLMTELYLEQSTGESMPFADEACESEAPTGAAESVEVQKIEVDRDRATAIVSYEGGSMDGSQLVMRLVERDGTWRVDRLIRFADFDRVRFRRAYRTKLQRISFDKMAINCVLDREWAFPDATVERAILEPPDDPAGLYSALLVECARDEIEHNVLGAIEDPGLGLSDRGIACGRRRLAAAGDELLMQLQLDIPTYARVVINCDEKALLDYYRRDLAEGRGLDPAPVECVLRILRGPPAKVVRLTYDQDRFEALVDDCESGST